MNLEVLCKTAHDDRIKVGMLDTDVKRMKHCAGQRTKFFPMRKKFSQRMQWMLRMEKSAICRQVFWTA